MPDTDVEHLIDRLNRFEEALHQRWIDDDKRHVERHSEVVRRLSNVEIQTTATNGRVKALELQEAVRAKLEEQAQRHAEQEHADSVKRGDRVRQWWVPVMSWGLATVITVTLFIIMQMTK